MTMLAFIDTETTGLDRRRHEVWDIGIILRKPEQADVEYSWLIRPDLKTADPTGLRIGRYYQRIGTTALKAWPAGTGLRTIHPDGDYHSTWDVEEIAADVARLLDGVIIVGAVPDFDDAMLGKFLRANSQAATWHYHLVDVETLAAGALKLAPPWNFDTVLDRYGLKYDEVDRHTAIGDARMARDLYDAILGEGGTT